MTSCKFCGEESVVYLVDERMLPVYVSGNKYSKTCLSCERYLGMTSERSFRRGLADDNAYLLPKDGDRYDDDTFENAFFCPYPDCDNLVVRHPDECPSCEGGYDW